MKTCSCLLLLCKMSIVHKHKEFFWITRSILLNHQQFIPCFKFGWSLKVLKVSVCASPSCPFLSSFQNSVQTAIITYTTFVSLASTTGSWWSWALGFCLFDLCVPSICYLQLSGTKLPGTRMEEWIHKWANQWRNKYSETMQAHDFPSKYG